MVNDVASKWPLMYDATDISLSSFGNSIRICGRNDSLDTCLKVSFQVVLPQSDDCPAHVAQLAVILSISFDGLGYLGLPEIRNLVFPVCKFIPVPKVTVHKYCHSCFGENYVRFAGQLS